MAVAVHAIAQDLPADRIAARPEVLDRHVVFGPDPAVAVAVEEDFARPVGTVGTGRVPQPPIEEDRRTRRDADGYRAFRVVDVRPVAAVLENHDLGAGEAPTLELSLPDRYSRIVTTQQPVNEKGMQPYSTTIAGSEVSFDMVPIPAGKFKMGSPLEEKHRSANEQQHDVTVSKPFYLARYLMTQGQYVAIMGNNCRLSPRS